MKEMIVKVQISLATSDGVPSVLVYDEAQDFMYEGEPTPEILEAMDGEHRKFFNAQLTIDVMGDKQFDLMDEVPEQDW